MLTIPGRCWLCQCALALPHWGICSRCHPRRPDNRVCPCCGLASHWPHQPCGRCLRKPCAWQRLVCIDDYRPPFSQMISRLKTYPEGACALARLLLLRLLEARRIEGLKLPQLIIPVPLHRKRIWRRGYNQSALLAGYLGRWLGIPVAEHAIRRLRHTPHQRKLSAHARRHNLLKAFHLEIAVNGRHIAIVDDVVTTGSTAAALARLLLARGAASVDIWCLCRTL